MVCSRLGSGVLLASLVLGGCLSSAGDRPESQVSPELAQDSIERHAREITLRVRNSTCVSLGMGSGFALDKTTLVTNRHVVEGADELEINTWDGESITVDVAEVALGSDLAIVEVDSDLPGIATLADDNPDPGESVTAVGFPDGSELAFSEGRIKDYTEGEEFGETGDIMRADFEIHPGNSGGAVLNEEGEVAGVVFAIEVLSDYGLAIPVSTLRAATAAASFAPVESTCEDIELDERAAPVAPNPTAPVAPTPTMPPPAPTAPPITEPPCPTGQPRAEVTSFDLRDDGYGTWSATVSGVIVNDASASVYAGMVWVDAGTESTSGLTDGLGDVIPPGGSVPWTAEMYFFDTPPSGATATMAEWLWDDWQLANCPT